MGEAKRPFTGIRKSAISASSQVLDQNRKVGNGLRIQTGSASRPVLQTRRAIQSANVSPPTREKRGAVGMSARVSYKILWLKNQKYFAGRFFEKEWKCGDKVEVRDTERGEACCEPKKSDKQMRLYFSLSLSFSYIILHCNDNWYPAHRTSSPTDLCVFVWLALLPLNVVQSRRCQYMPAPLQSNHPSWLPFFLIFELSLSIATLQKSLHKMTSLFKSSITLQNLESDLQKHFKTDSKFGPNVNFRDLGEGNVSFYSRLHW